MSVTRVSNKVSAIKFRVIQRLRRLSSTINDEPIIVLGNQKSGTSAVVCLLGEASKRSYTNDIFTWFGEAESSVLDGQLPFDEFVQTARYYFSKTFIKDPGLTFIFNQLDERFPSAKYVFVIRHPLTNIRSILNRLNIPGDLEDLRDEHWEYVRTARPNWRPVLTGQSGGYLNGNYIERLAHRCRLALELAASDQNRWKIVRYEDFVADKAATISRTLEWLGFSTVADISSIVDKPFQPASAVVTPPMEFFGERNHKLIVDICSSSMSKHGYELST